jgi:transcriptional regulator with XRE-family HTH domain
VDLRPLPRPQHPVRARREECGLLLKELAGALGMSAARLSMIESGYDPKPQTQLRIAETLSCDVRRLWPDRWEAINGG